MIIQQCRALGLTPPVPAETAVTAALAFGLGLGLQRAADPSIPGSVFADVLAMFLATTDTGGRAPLRG
jgi:hypothetical protein